MLGLVAFVPIPTNSLVSRAKVQFPLADHDQCPRAGSPFLWECSCPRQTRNARAAANVHPCLGRADLLIAAAGRGDLREPGRATLIKGASDAGNRGPSNHWAGLNAILPLARGAISHWLADGIHPFS